MRWKFSSRSSGWFNCQSTKGLSIVPFGLACRRFARTSVTVSVNQDPSSRAVSPFDTEKLHLLPFRLCIPLVQRLRFDHSDCGGTVTSSELDVPLLIELLSFDAFLLVDLLWAVSWFGSLTFWTATRSTIHGSWLLSEAAVQDDLRVMTTWSAIVLLMVTCIVRALIALVVALWSVSCVVVLAGLDTLEVVALASSVPVMVAAFSACVLGSFTFFSPHPEPL